MNEPGRTAPPQAGLLRTIRTVFWSFFGVRKSSDHARDAAQLKPAYVIVAGLVGALIFVLILILIVKSVVN